MIHFLGTSYAAVTLKEAARRRGLPITENIKDANLIFVSEDMPTDEYGNRNTARIFLLVQEALRFDVPIVLTSQVTPGFCHKIGCERLYHQAETLRIEDGMQRAMYPEMFIVGEYGLAEIDPRYMEYLKAFDCPILKMSYEEAEFSKIAINAFLISQIETSNMLSKAAVKYGAVWGKVAQALRHDSRIGKFAYLTPGDWKKSKHLLRDYVTLAEVRDYKLLDAWK